MFTELLNQAPKVVGTYRLAMKSGSDHTGAFAIQIVMKRLKAMGVEALLYELSLDEYL